MTRVAYLDLVSGASGDMLIGSAISAGRSIGADVEKPVARAIEELGLGCSLAVEPVTRGGLAALHVRIVEGETYHGVEALRSAISAVPVPAPVRERALAGFEALVEAEAHVHGVDPNDVHLHELGGADTAADLVGAAVGLDALGVTRIVSSPIPVPRGWTSGEHGDIPLPAPATVHLMRGARIAGVASRAELVTPTATAILAGHVATYGPLPELVLEAVGTGAGSRELDHPNICRLFVGRLPEQPGDIRLHENVLLEANIDDQTPEALGHALQMLVKAGALDAWITPIVMKKSRSAFLLSVLVSADHETDVLRTLFRETTTLGARRRRTQKWVLDRHTIEVDGIRIKIGRLDGDVVTVSPEFDDCVAAAERTGVPFRDIYARAAAAARAQLAP